MSRRQAIVSFNIMEDVDLTASAESVISNIQNLDNIGIMISTTGVTDNDGAFSVQVSNDKEIWATLPFTDPITGTQVTSIALADANEIIALSLNQVCFTWLKLVFTDGTGTDGTVTATLSAKQL